LTDSDGKSKRNDKSSDWLWLSALLSIDSKLLGTNYQRKKRFEKREANR
jgi:hypothetical protein